MPSDKYRIVEKLSYILNESSIKSVTIAHMEFPCCFGLNKIIKEAFRRSGRSIPIEDVTVTIAGEKKEAA